MDLLRAPSREIVEIRSAFPDCPAEAVSLALGLVDDSVSSAVDVGVDVCEELSACAEVDGAALVVSLSLEELLSVAGEAARPGTSLSLTDSTLKPPSPKSIPSSFTSSRPPS